MQEEHNVPLPPSLCQVNEASQGQSGPQVCREGGKLPGEPSPLTSQFSTTQNSSMAVFAKSQTFPPAIRSKGTLGGGDGVVVF